MRSSSGDQNSTRISSVKKKKKNVPDLVGEKLLLSGSLYMFRRRSGFFDLLLLPVKFDVMRKIEIPDESSALRHEEIAAGETPTPNIEEIIAEDGILSLILSFLNLKEAVRTSVLSSRWRHIWTHLTIFNFNPISVLDAPTLHSGHPGSIETYETYNLTKGKADKFIQIVDSIMQQLQGARLDEFAVRYFLDKSHSHHLDTWVSSAVASQTKLLALHLFESHEDSSIKPYDFPCHLLRSSRSIEIFSLLFCSLKLPTEFDVFGHLKLKRLILIQVDISQEDFDRILPNSYSTLLRLCVWGAPQLVSISLPQPLTQLQTLRIHSCNQLRKIEINAVNLHKLIYNGFLMDFKFRQSTKLVDAEICFNSTGTPHNLEFYLTKLSSNLAHLQKLTLKLGAISQMADLPKGSCRFIHLRHLDLQMDDSTKMGLLDLATLMDAAPFLEELKLCLPQRVLGSPPRTPEKFRKMLPKHSHLKKIEVSGFYFEMWQIEIAIYLLNNATELESMMIEKGSTLSEEVLQRRTEILAREVPVKVKFVVF